MPKPNEFTPQTTLGNADIVPFLRATGALSPDPEWEDCQINKSDLARALVISKGNQLIDGGNVVWVSGYTFRVGLTTVDFNGVTLEFAQTDITLDAPDATDPRVDLIVADQTTGTLIKITGTPSTPPATPDYDPTTQFQLNSIPVDAASSQPSIVTRTWLYQENTEWTFSSSGGTWNANSTASPFAGTKAIEATSSANNHYFKLQNATTLDINTYDLLYFYINPKAAWGSRYLRFHWETTNGQRKGNFFSLSNGILGLNTSSAAYQLIAIPISAFAVPSGTLVQALKATVISTSGTIGFHIDNLALQIGIEQPVSPIPIASTTNKGIVELAEDGETAAGVVVQANDTRLAQAAAALPKAGGTMTGALVLAADPVSAMQAATQAYVDAKATAAAAGLDWKGSVRVATTANITLSGAQTIDGTSVVAGDRVLVKDQSTGSQNGIYVCASGSWTRATDADDNTEVNPGMFVIVEEGTTNGDTGWFLTTNAPITLGTTSLTFARFKPALNDNEVTYAKLQDVTATQRLIGRNTAGSGDPEEVTATQLLDWLGSTRGSVLIKGVSGWTILAPGTSGYALFSNGAGADPSYQSVPSAGLAATGSAFVIIGGSSSGTTNGTSLLNAYTTAKTATPHGAALSTSNRYTILLLPGVYDLGSSTLTLDTQYIDIVGMSTNSGSMVYGSGTLDQGDTIITSSGTTVNINDGNTHNIVLANLCLRTTTSSSSSYCLSTSQNQFQTNFLIQNVLFAHTGSANPTRAMPSDKSFYGTWVDVRCWYPRCFGDALFSNVTVGGTFIRCKGGATCFGNVANPGGTVPTLSGVFIDCEADQGGFGNTTTGGGSTLSGTFINCRGGLNLGGGGAGSSFGGTGGVMSGYFQGILCYSVNNNFGGGTMSGTMVGCSGTAAVSWTSVTGKIIGCDFPSYNNSVLTVPGISTFKQARFTQTAVTYGSTTTFDFNDPDEQTLTLTGNPTFATSNRAAGRSKVIKIDPGASNRTITYPAWVPINAALPTTFLANKIVILTLKCWGSAETDIVAAVGAQP